jgi:hypothetical protein
MAIDLRGRSVSFYDDISLFPGVGSLNTLYVDRDSNQIYAWNGSDYEILSNDGVPYTGATANVDLGEFELKAGQLELDQTPTGTAGVAVMRWNDTDGTVDLGLKGGKVTLQIGQEQVLRVVNKTGSDLLESQYKVVRIRTQAEGGAAGQRLAIKLAQANTKANHSGILGVVTEDINNNQEGFITSFGNINKINTTGSLQGETWLDGDNLWLSDTVAGGLTNVEPITHPVRIGYVLYAHAVNGKIFISLENGVDELNELHDVLINSGTLANNDALIYESSTQLWKNKAISTGITVGTTTSTGTDGRVFFQAGGVVQQDSAFFWDNTNKRLGVGATPASTVRLDVRAQGALVSDIAFRVRNSADTGDLAYINGVGDVALSSATITAGSGGNGTAIAIGAGAATNTAFTTYPIAIGRNSSSNGNSIAIGNSTFVGTGQSTTSSLVIGYSSTSPSGLNNNVIIGNSITGTNSSGENILIGDNINFAGNGKNTFGIALGRFFGANAFVSSGAYAIGSGVSAASPALLNITDSFSVYFRNTERSFFVNKNTNIVMRSVSALTAGTHYETAATNTLTIHNGTAPITTIANAGQLYVESGALRYRDSNGTITNAGGTVQSVASAATVTPVATNKLVKITAQAVGLTLAVPTGTIADGQDLMIRIKDSGSAQTIAWTSGTGGYRAIGVTLPTTTTAGKTTYVGLIYNSDDSRWDAVGVTTEV